MNAQNTNNTSSKFSLPSEFKENWNNLVTEGILDAFPDFLDKFQYLTPLIHELFIYVKSIVENRQQKIIENLKQDMNLKDEGVDKTLHSKLKNVF